MQLTMHSDPGHGWLEVPRGLLDTLGIAGDISAFSYIHGDRAYLEEDCDASRFAEAMKAAGQTFTVKGVHTNHDHWIRNLHRFI
jgi:hypothetical protein